MPKQDRHGFCVDFSHDEAARIDYLSSLRGYVLHDMAAQMRAAYDDQVTADFVHQHGRKPQNGDEVHDAMASLAIFKAYGAARVTAQELVWHSLIRPVARHADAFAAIAAKAAQENSAGGSVVVDAKFHVPENVSGIDVHLQEGAYCHEDFAGDVSSPAVLDHGLTAFTFGLLGPQYDDIGRSIARFIHYRYPEFRPLKILDTGCTFGKNLLPWKNQYPDAEIYAIDVAGPSLLYGHAQAESQGLAVHFRQMSADDLQFEDGSFDLVFSSMFLHEISRDTTDKTFDEIYRVLKPGGFMLHMELPPNNSQAEPYDSFYLDWDNYYNAEPFYKAYRDQDPKTLCVRAGFAKQNYVQFIIPSLYNDGEEAVKQAALGRSSVDQDTGVFRKGVQWFTFGAWKE